MNNILSIMQKRLQEQIGKTNDIKAVLDEGELSLQVFPPIQKGFELLTAKHSGNHYLLDYASLYYHSKKTFFDEKNSTRIEQIPVLREIRENIEWVRDMPDVEKVGDQDCLGLVLVSDKHASYRELKDSMYFFLNIFQEKIRN